MEQIRRKQFISKENTVFREFFEDYRRWQNKQSRLNNQIGDSECHTPRQRGMHAMRMTQILKRHKPINNRSWMQFTHSGTLDDYQLQQKKLKCMLRQSKRFDSNQSDSRVLDKLEYTPYGFSGLQTPDGRGLANTILNAKEELKQVSKMYGNRSEVDIKSIDFFGQMNKGVDQRKPWRLFVHQQKQQDCQNQPVIKRRRKLECKHVTPCQIDLEKQQQSSLTDKRKLVQSSRKMISMKQDILPEKLQTIRV